MHADQWVRILSHGAVYKHGALLLRSRVTVGYYSSMGHNSSMGLYSRNYGSLIKMFVLFQLTWLQGILQKGDFHSKY